MNKPMVVKVKPFSIQVCVPREFTDEQIEEFANSENFCGTTLGWVIRKEGSEYLQGDPERNPCDKRNNCVHVMLDC